MQVQYVAIHKFFALNSIILFWAFAGSLKLLEVHNKVNLPKSYILLVYNYYYLVSFLNLQFSQDMLVMNCCL